MFTDYTTKENKRQMEAEAMKKFETGKTYTMRSAGDHNCAWEYEVISRTEKMVVLLDKKTSEEKRCRINSKLSEYRGTETVLPLGNYSMAPVLSA